MLPGRMAGRREILVDRLPTSSSMGDEPQNQDMSEWKAKRRRGEEEVVVEWKEGAKNEETHKTQ